MSIAILGVGTQMYNNGGHVSDWHAVGGAALQGGVTGSLAGLTGGTSLLRSGAVGAVSNVAGGIARNVYDGKPITVGSVAKDAAIGAAAGIAGHAAGKAVGAIANRLKSGAAASEVAVVEDAAWKSKISGRAQKTGTPGHQMRSYREAIKAAKDPDVAEVHLDHGYNRVAGTKAAGNTRVSPNRRPDVSIVNKNGTIDAIEVPSRTDVPANLIQRNQAAMSQLPVKQQGQVILAPIQ